MSKELSTDELIEKLKSRKLSDEQFKEILDHAVNSDRERLENMLKKKRTANDSDITDKLYTSEDSGIHE